MPTRQYKQEMARRKPHSPNMGQLCWYACTAYTGVDWAGLAGLRNRHGTAVLGHVQVHRLQLHELNQQPHCVDLNEVDGRVGVHGRNDGLDHL